MSGCNVKISAFQLMRVKVYYIPTNSKDAGFKIGIAIPTESNLGYLCSYIRKNI